MAGNIPTTKDNLKCVARQNAATAKEAMRESWRYSALADMHQNQASKLALTWREIAHRELGTARRYVRMAVRAAEASISA